MSYLDSVIVNDLLQSASRPKICLVWSIWSSMISYKASIAQIFFSMIVNDLLRILGRPNIFFIRFLWLSLISLKASVA